MYKIKSQRIGLALSGLLLLFVIASAAAEPSDSWNWNDGDQVEFQYKEMVNDVTTYEGAVYLVVEAVADDVLNFTIDHDDENGNVHLFDITNATTSTNVTVMIGGEEVMLLNNQVDNLFYQSQISTMVTATYDELVATTTAEVEMYGSVAYTIEVSAINADGLYGMEIKVEKVDGSVKKYVKYEVDADGVLANYEKTLEVGNLVKSYKLSIPESKEDNIPGFSAGAPIPISIASIAVIGLIVGKKK